jgi:hypothetical protein
MIERLSGNTSKWHDVLCHYRIIPEAKSSQNEQIYIGAIFDASTSARA